MYINHIGIHTVLYANYSSIKLEWKKSKKENEDLPGDPLVENPPTNTGDTSSIPALGRFHMLKAKAVVLPLLKRKCWGKALKILAHIKTSL